MQNIVSKMTGASVKLISAGSNVKITIEGTAAQVEHAVTLLYNYGAIGEVPCWYEASFTYMELLAGKRVFYRGLLCLTYTQETTREGKHDVRGRCARAIVKCAHHVSSLLANAVPTESAADLLPA
jgi:hypothetical protein